jgi:two-component system KDP operon response regulator KdpE
MQDDGTFLPSRMCMGPEYGNEHEYLRVLINQLRKKIEDDPTYTLTESYIGYHSRET